ncbi:MAG: U32 family peptidase [Alistipes sp.]|nr:U32 family peptidase [Candidatus Minthomonas equi]
MERKMESIPEIMAPAGCFECLMAAIQGGAGSVYFGVENLNMRSHSANNFLLGDLPEIVRICSENGVRSYLTLNITLYNEDLERAYRTLDAAVEAGVSAVIASDMAVITYARKIGLEVHISTQLSISNIESLRFYAQFADVIVLARELNMGQVKRISEAIRKENICGPSGKQVRIEMFCHGALCMAVSGKCYLSLHDNGHSANRGSCMQMCRRGYEVTDLETGNRMVIDNKYIMSPKDLCTIGFLDVILEAGVSVLKIEGRARSAEYVKTVVEAYREGVDAVCAGTYSDGQKESLKTRLATVFNRGFWDGYYQGARLGEWCNIYGNSATTRKQYIGKVNNYFSNIGVAEIKVEACPIAVGEHMMIIGPTTGVLEFDIPEIRVDLVPVQTAQQGVACSIPVPKKLRRADKVFIVRQVPVPKYGEIIR